MRLLSPSFILAAAAVVLPLLPVGGAEVAVPIAAQILGYYFKLPPLEVGK